MNAQMPIYTVSVKTLRNAEIPGHFTSSAWAPIVLRVWPREVRDEED